MTPVAIALVQRGGRYLVRRRPETPGSPMPGYWEFPGGKCEPGEPPEHTAARECLEESGMAVVVGPLRRQTDHHYPHGHVTLHYFACEPRGPDDEPTESSGFRWVAARDLRSLQFPDANGPILDDLAREAGADRDD